MKRGLLVAALLGAAFAMTACHPADPSVAPSAGLSGGSSESAPPPATPTTAAPPSSPAATSFPAPATDGKVDCGHWAVTLGASDAGAGHHGRVLLIRNTGTSVCNLKGYPGVAALGPGDRQVAQAQRTPNGYLGGLAQGASIPELTLAPGESASATVEGLASNQDGSACTAYKGLLVTPPDQTVSTKLAFTPDFCSNLEIHPVVAGSKGRQ
jgi:hypothetical protein